MSGPRVIQRRHVERGSERGPARPQTAGTAPALVPGADPAMLSPAMILQLQRTAGNAYVQRLIQRKSASDPTAPDTVQTGSNGPAVEEVQQHLNRHGAKPELKVDGAFGPKTCAAAKAFQSGHADAAGKALAPDGVVGPLTWRALQNATPSAAPVDGSEHPRDELPKLLAKGDAMTPAEASRAKELLFKLQGDEFRSAIKSALASGGFLAMVKKLDLAAILDTFSNLTQEVVVTTTLLKPATDTIAADFTRANAIYNPHGFEFEQGNHIELSEKATRRLLGGDTDLDEFTGDQATAEELKLVEMNRMKGRIAAYFVPTFSKAPAAGSAVRRGGSRGEALLKDDLANMGDDRSSVVVNTSSRAQDTFAHEVGHALGLPHFNADANNLMADGTTRNITGPGIDKLTDAQMDIIRNSVFTELGRKGVGK